MEVVNTLANSIDELIFANEIREKNANELRSSLNSFTSLEFNTVGDNVLKEFFFQLIKLLGIGEDKVFFKLFVKEIISPTLEKILKTIIKAVSENEKNVLNLIPDNSTLNQQRKDGEKNISDIFYFRNSKKFLMSQVLFLITRKYSVGDEIRNILRQSVLNNIINHFNLVKECGIISAMQAEKYQRYVGTKSANMGLQIRVLRESLYSCHLLLLAYFSSINNYNAITLVRGEHIGELGLMLDVKRNEEHTFLRTLRLKITEMTENMEYQQRISLIRAVEGFVSMVTLGVGLIARSEDDSSNISSQSLIIEAFRGDRETENNMKGTKPILFKGKVAKRMIEMCPPQEILCIPPWSIHEMYFDIVRQLLSADNILTVQNLSNLDVISSEHFASSCKLAKKNQLKIVQLKTQQVISGSGGANVNIAQATLSGEYERLMKNTLPFTSNIAHLCDLISFIFSILPAGYLKTNAPLSDQSLDLDDREIMFPSFDNELATFIFNNMLIHIETLIEEAGEYLPLSETEGDVIKNVAIRVSKKTNAWQSYFVRVIASYIGALSTIACLNKNYASRVFSLLNGEAVINFTQLSEQFQLGLDRQFSDYLSSKEVFSDQRQRSGTVLLPLKLNFSWQNKVPLYVQSSAEYLLRCYDQFSIAYSSVITNILIKSPSQPLEKYFSLGQFVELVKGRRNFTPESLSSIIDILTSMINSPDELNYVWELMAKNGLFNHNKVSEPFANAETEQSGSVGDEYDGLPGHIIKELTTGTFPITRSFLLFMFKTVKIILRNRVYNILHDATYKNMILFTCREIVSCVTKRNVSSDDEFNEISFFAFTFLSEVLLLSTLRTPKVETSIATVALTEKVNSSTKSGVIPSSGALTVLKPPSVEVPVFSTDELLCLALSPNDCVTELLTFLEAAVSDAINLQFIPHMRNLGVQAALDALSFTITLKEGSSDSIFSMRVQESSLLATTLLHLATFFMDVNVTRRALLILSQIHPCACTDAAQEMYENTDLSSLILERFYSIIMTASDTVESSNMSTSEAYFHTRPAALILLESSLGGSPSRLTQDLPSVAKCLFDLLLQGSQRTAPSLTTWLCGFTRDGRALVQTEHHCLVATTKRCVESRFLLSPRTGALAAKGMQLIYALLQNPTTLNNEYVSLVSECVSKAAPLALQALSSDSPVYRQRHKENGFDLKQVNGISTDTYCETDPRMEGASVFDSVSTDASSATPHIVNFAGHALKVLAHYTFLQSVSEKSNVSQGHGSAGDCSWLQSEGSEDFVVKYSKSVMALGIPFEEAQQQRNFSAGGGVEYEGSCGVGMRSSRVPAVLATLPPFPRVTLPEGSPDTFIYHTVEHVPQYSIPAIHMQLKAKHGNVNSAELTERLRLYVYANSCLMHYAAASIYVEGWTRLLEILCATAQPGDITLEGLLATVEELTDTLYTTRVFTRAAQAQVVEIVSKGLAALALSLPRAQCSGVGGSLKNDRMHLLRLMITRTVHALVSFGFVSPAARKHLYTALEAMLCAVPFSVIPERTFLESKQGLLNMLLLDVTATTQHFCEYINSDTACGDREIISAAALEALYLDLAALAVFRRLLMIPSFIAVFAHGSASEGGFAASVSMRKSAQSALVRQDTEEEAVNGLLVAASGKRTRETGTCGASSRIGSQRCSKGLIDLVQEIFSAQNISLMAFLNGMSNMASFVVEFTTISADILTLCAAQFPCTLFLAHSTVHLRQMGCWRPAARAIKAAVEAGGRDDVLSLCSDVVLTVVVESLRWLTTLLSTEDMQHNSECARDVADLIYDNSELFSLLLASPLRRRQALNGAPVISKVDLELVELSTLLTVELWHGAARLERPLCDLTTIFNLVEIATVFARDDLAEQPIFIVPEAALHAREPSSFFRARQAMQLFRPCAASPQQQQIIAMITRNIAALAALSALNVRPRLLAAEHDDVGVKGFISADQNGQGTEEGTFTGATRSLKAIFKASIDSTGGRLFSVDFYPTIIRALGCCAALASNAVVEELLRPMLTDSAATVQGMEALTSVALGNSIGGGGAGKKGAQPHTSVIYMQAAKLLTQLVHLALHEMRLHKSSAGLINVEPSLRGSALASNAASALTFALRVLADIAEKLQMQARLCAQSGLSIYPLTPLLELSAPPSSGLASGVLRPESGQREGVNETRNDFVDFMLRDRANGVGALGCKNNSVQLPSRPASLWENKNVVAKTNESSTYSPRQVINVMNAIQTLRSVLLCAIMEVEQIERDF